MWVHALYGIAVPFLGTALGALCVFFMKNQPDRRVNRALAGFAAGVMVAASVWSLLIPAIDSSPLGKLSFLPSFVGFWLGVFSLLLLERLFRRMDVFLNDPEKNGRTKTLMTAVAVTLHNLPEGIAVGIVYAGLLSGASDVTAGGAFVLSFGIAAQNFPEGAIVSMPLHADGKSKPKAFALGVLSGAVEPLGAFPAVAAAPLLVPAMPYLLSFAAGAMIYVVVVELIPDISDGSPLGVLAFSAGFTIMMALDIGLG